MSGEEDDINLKIYSVVFCSLSNSLQEEVSYYEVQRPHYLGNLPINILTSIQPLKMNSFLLTSWQKSSHNVQEKKVSTSTHKCLIATKQLPSINTLGVLIIHSRKKHLIKIDYFRLRLFKGLFTVSRVENYGFFISSLWRQQRQ